MGVFFILVVAGVVVFASIKSAKAAQQQWKAAADRLHLAYHEGGLGSSGTISGKLNDHRVTVNTVSKGNGNSSSTHTRYRLEYRNPIPLDLKIARQGVLHEIGKTFGMQDIETGNPAFDNRLMVRGAMPDKVRSFLTPKLQAAICDLSLSYGDLTVTGSHVEIIKSGKDADSAIIVHCVRRLAGFCEQMMENNAESETSQKIHAVEKRPPAMPIIEIEPPEIPFDQLATANPVVPEPPDVPESAIIDEPEGTVDTDDGSAPAEPGKTGNEIPVDLEQAAKELFGEAGSSLLASRIFAERFKDRMVSGSGKLRHVGKFSYDPVFTNAIGVKATVELCELAGAYSKIKVVAEIMYPIDQHDSLNSRIGAVLPVAGKLVAQDTMMRRLFIEST